MLWLGGYTHLLGVPGSLVGVCLTRPFGLSMPDSQLHALARQPLSVLSVEGQEAAGGLASSPWAMPGFFAGWIGIGLSLALLLVRRGHDTRTMIALGIGLGPLMALVASETIRRRESSATALTLQHGIDRGGLLDVLVLVQDGDCDVDVEGLVPTIESVRGELGLLTLARAVPYEWLEGDLDNEVVRAGERALVDAEARLAVRGAELALLPGRVDRAVERFGRRRRRRLVLTALPSAPVDPRGMR